MRGLGGQPGPGAGRNRRCVSDRELRRSSPFDVAVAWDSHSIAGSFRVTSRRHATALQERLEAIEPDRAAVNRDRVAVRVMETTAHQLEAVGTPLDGTTNHEVRSASPALTRAPPALCVQTTPAPHASLHAPGLPRARFDWTARRPGDHAPSLALLDRSEEHTSELQSHSDLVCRLLLEKKK